MTKFEKIISELASGKKDKNFNFEALCNILETLGFDNRIKGSHHIYFKKGIIETINLQPDGSKAKSYQVKQVRNLLLKYNLIISKNE